MSQVIQPNPHNAQRKPAEWDGLIDVANAAIDPAQPYSGQSQALLDVWCEVGSMDIETVEANRYYGLGLVACTFARACAGEAGCQRLIDTAVQGLTGPRHVGYAVEQSITARKRRSQGLYLGELSPSPPFVPYAFGRDSYDRLPLAERVVSNGLEGLPKVPFFARRNSLSLIRTLLDDPAYRNVSDNAFAGATSLLRLALQRVHEARTGIWISKEDMLTTPIKAMADEATIAGLELTHTAAVMAALRTDEMLLIGKIVQSDAAGRFYPERAAIPETPSPTVAVEARNIVHHTKRLGCPALYIAGLIPLVATALPEIVNEAQRRLLAPGRVPRIII